MKTQLGIKEFTLVKEPQNSKSRVEDIKTNNKRTNHAPYSVLL